ncbi:MAG TPA: hypothetical protein VG456_16450 [Candidatus Sulfopaludibacter sp.]|nr:hypothetical protein [Candidatus Sulfopaludibacter sp.]
MTERCRILGDDDWHWPPRGSGKLREFPEVDRIEWFPLPLARQKILAGQSPLLGGVDQSEPRRLTERCRIHAHDVTCSATTTGIGRHFAKRPTNRVAPGQRIFTRNGTKMIS